MDINDNIEVAEDKDRRSYRYMKSTSAREHRKEIKTIKEKKMIREQKESAHLLKKHTTIVKNKKKVLDESPETV